MHKFSFENTYPNQLGTSIEFKVPLGASLGDMLEQFQAYLKATGYVFEGYLDFVDDEDSLSIEFDESQEDWEIHHMGDGNPDQLSFDFGAAQPVFTVDTDTAYSVKWPSSYNYDTTYNYAPEKG